MRSLKIKDVQGTPGPAPKGSGASPAASQGPDVWPAGEYLVGTVACLYGEKTGLPRRMYSHALQNGLEFTGPAYAVYLFDAASTADAERRLLQIAVMVKKAEQI